MTAAHLQHKLRSSKAFRPRMYRLPKQLTLTHLLDWRNLALFMGWPWVADGETEEWSNTGYAGVRHRVQLTNEEATKRRWSDLLCQRVNVGHPCERKQQTRGQWMAECLSQGLGIKKGSIAARIEEAKRLRPDLYDPNWQATPEKAEVPAAFVDDYEPTVIQ